jgi:hypothetical protein
VIVTAPLRDRVREYLEAHPDGALIEDIARGVRARTADVRDVVLAEPAAFRSSLRGSYPSDRALLYRFDSERQDGPGRAKKPSQCDLILGVLRDGQWHTTEEIHKRCGFSRLNSRISDLRKRGLTIDSEHVAGEVTGPRAHRYRLVETREEVATDLRDTSLPDLGGPAASSGASAKTGQDEAPEHQLSLGEAA